MRLDNMRFKHEVAHSEHLALGETEVIWGWGSAAGQVRARRRASLIMHGAGLKPGKRVLEIGCGTGLFTEVFARSGAELIAVDLSSSLLEKARKRGLPEKQVRFLEMPFEMCDPEAPFDAVIGSSILHHLHLEKALIKIFDLLKPGGWLSFAEPNMLNPQVFLERRFRSLFPHVSPDETAFVRWHITRQLASFGFDTIEVVPFDWLHPGLLPAFIAPVTSLGRLLEVLPGVREFAGSLYIRARRPKRSSSHERHADTL